MAKSSSEPSFEQSTDQTTTIAVPLTALAITVILLIIAFPVTRSLFGKSLRAIEEKAIPAAETYLTTLSKNQPTADLIHLEFAPEEPDFRQRLVKALGEYQTGKFKSVRSNNDKPPKIIVRLEGTGTQGKADITIVLEPTANQKFLVREGVVTKK